MSATGGAKMTPEPPGIVDDDGTNLHPVDLPDLQSLGAHQSVILVADDEPLIRNLVTLLMQHEGYFVLSAADGHEGLELSRKYPGSIRSSDYGREHATDERHRPMWSSDGRTTRN